MWVNHLARVTDLVIIRERTKWKRKLLRVVWMKNHLVRRLNPIKVILYYAIIHLVVQGVRTSQPVLVPSLLAFVTVVFV